MHDRNILFKKNKKEYFLNDFALRNPKNKIKKRKPISGFFVKNQSHRNFLIKKTYNYSLKLINLINQDLKHNYKLNYKLKDLNRFLLPWAFLYVTFFYSIHKRSKELKKNKYKLILQNYKFKYSKVNKESYQSFNLYYEAWKDIYYFSNQAQKKNNKLFFKAYNEKYTLSKKLNYYFSKLSIFFGKIFHKKIVLINLNLGKKNILKLIFKSFFKFCYFFPKEKQFEDLVIQKSTLDIKSNDDFLKILMNYYKKYIFSNYMSILFNSKRNYSQHTILTHELMSTETINRNFLLSNPNHKIYAIQHGGGYCVDQYNLSEMIEKKISTSFIPWGKSKKKNKISLPEKTLKNNSINQNIISYISTAPQRCLLRFDDNIYPQYVKNIYFKDQNNIIKALSNHKFKTIVRLDKANYWSNNDYLRKKIKFNNILINDGKLNYDKDFEKSSIILTDYLGSTYLKSLLLNKPTIIYCNKKFNFIKKNKEKYFNRLKNISIFFDDIDMLILFLNKLNSPEKIQKWWFDKKLQSTIKKFNREFQYSSKNWDTELIKKFYCE